MRNTKGISYPQSEKLQLYDVVLSKLNITSVDTQTVIAGFNLIRAL